MASPHDNLIELIKKLDVNDDGIKMNQKIKSVETIFHDIVSDEDKLIEILEYINDCVLKDLNMNTAQNFAMLMTTRNFDKFTINNTVLRYKMINLLQKNFMKYDEYSKNDKNMLYNSITLLGEFYQRFTISNGSCISDLGDALLDMLTKEINHNNSESISIDINLAKLILSQVTLNGKLLQTYHKEKFNILLFHIRRLLIELNDIKSCIKALLLMTLDLFYNNFCSLGAQLEEMYTKYLIEVENIENDSTIMNENVKIKNGNSYVNDIYHNKNEEHQKNEREESINKCKKWSEQVHEENLEMLSLNNASDSNSSAHSKNRRGNERKNSIRSKDSDDDYNNQFCEHDEDQQSIRSEGGTLRLYSVKDRLVNSQTNNVPPTTFTSQKPSDIISSSRNDRQHYLSDRIRENTKTNQSANNYNRNNNSNYNNFSTRNTFNRLQQYDRPPRFNKFQTNSNYNQNHQQQSQNTWREEGSSQHNMNFDRRGNDREYKRGGYLNDSSANRNPNHRNNRNFSMRRSPLNNYHQRDISFDRKSSDSNRHYRRGGGNMNNSLRGSGRNYRDNSHDDKRYNNENYRNYNRRQSVESTGNEGNIKNPGRYGSQNSLVSEQSKSYGTHNRRSRFPSTNRSQEYSY